MLAACGLAMTASMARAQENPPPTPEVAASQPAATQAAGIPSLNRSIKNAQLIMQDLKETFATGAVQTNIPGGRADARMGILALLIEDKIRSTILRRIADPQEREAALAQLKVAQEYLANQFMPAYEKARTSRNPEDAKALVPLMDGLGERITKVQEVLPWQAPAVIAPSPTITPPVSSSSVTSKSPASQPSARPTPANRMPLRPGPVPADSWTQHVQQFITSHKLDSAQQEQAWSILKDLRGRRQEYRTAHRADYEAAARISDKTRQVAELQTLEKPIDGMFEELKTRLAVIPTEVERKPTATATASQPR